MRRRSAAGALRRRRGPAHGGGRLRGVVSARDARGPRARRSAVAPAAALRASARALAQRFVAERVPVFVGVDAPDFNLGLERKLKRAGVRTPASRQSVGLGMAARAAATRFGARSIGCSRCSPSSRRSTRRPECRSPSSAIRSPREAAVTRLAARGARPAETRRGPAGVRVAARAAGRRSWRCTASSSCGRPRHSTRCGRTRDFSCRSPPGRRATGSRQRSTGSGSSKLPLTLLYGHATDALRAADVALVASGTATLEAALARCPHVIFYRLNALTARIVRRRLLLPWVGLPNILAGKFVVPEMLQEDATAENLARSGGKPLR